MSFYDKYYDKESYSDKDIENILEYNDDALTLLENNDVYLKSYSVLVKIIKQLRS